MDFRSSGMCFMFLLFLLGCCDAFPQFITQPGTAYAHPAVLINAAMENTLPDYLRNNFYKSPQIAAGLAKESWFAHDETQVIDRDSDKIPREKIYNVLHSAGLARRR